MRRIYYVLQTIIPPILLVLLGFTAFITPKDRFPDRLRTLVCAQALISQTGLHACPAELHDACLCTCSCQRTVSNSGTA